MADVQGGDDPVAQCARDFVIRLFAVRPEFHCTRARRRSPKEPFRFGIPCWQSGPESSLHVECPMMGCTSWSGLTSAADTFSWSPGTTRCQRRELACY
jgi:hypothetical protein